MKRLCALLLLLAVVFSLAACGGDPAASSSESGSASESASESVSDGGSTSMVYVTGKTDAAFAAVYDTEAEKSAAEVFSALIANAGFAPLPVYSRAQWEAGVPEGGAVFVKTGKGAAIFDLALRHLTLTAPEDALSSAVTAAASALLSEGASSDGEGNEHLLLSDTVAEKMEEELLCSLATLTVMSQNIRCASDPNGNSVAERLPRFLQLMAAYTPDLLGTQETTHEWNTLFAEHLGEEYGMVGLSRGGYELYDAAAGKWDEWNTILYKKSRFELLDEGTFWLSDTPDVPSKVESSSLNRIVTWALLEDLHTGEAILFVNTHFEHTSEDARTDQAYILQEYLIEMVGEYPTYVTGDFNTSTDSVMYMAMTDLLGDAMEDAEEKEAEVDYTYHNYGAGEKYQEYIDFIFYSDGGRAPAFARILTEQYGGYVSDHYGVFAIFTKD